MEVIHAYELETVPSAVVANAQPSRVKCTLKMIDVLEGNRSNVVTVLVPNPKKPGSIAHRNYDLYEGQTVAAFLASYPAQDGGKTRARASLLWDIERGFVGVAGLAFETKA